MRTPPSGADTFDSDGRKKLEADIFSSIWKDIGSLIRENTRENQDERKKITTYLNSKASEPLENILDAAIKAVTDIKPYNDKEAIKQTNLIDKLQTMKLIQVTFILLETQPNNDGLDLNLFKNYSNVMSEKISTEKDQSFKHFLETQLQITGEICFNRLAQRVSGITAPSKETINTREMPKTASPSTPPEVSPINSAASTPRTRPPITPRASQPNSPAASPRTPTSRSPAITPRTSPRSSPAATPRTSTANTSSSFFNRGNTEKNTAGVLAYNEQIDKLWKLMPDKWKIDSNKRKSSDEKSEIYFKLVRKIDETRYDVADNKMTWQDAFTKSPDLKNNNVRDCIEKLISASHAKNSFQRPGKVETALREFINEIDNTLKLQGASNKR